jgi:hypothetical protein
VVASGDGESADLAFWAAATPEQRLAAVSEMAEQWYRQSNPDDPPLRLDRAVRAAVHRIWKTRGS